MTSISLKHVRVEQLESRLLWSGASAVVIERRQILQADLARINDDKVELAVVARLDLEAANTTTTADRGRVRSDTTRLNHDLKSAPSQVPSDLTQLETDESNLPTDIYSARAKAISDRGQLLLQLQQDRNTYFSDVNTHLVQPLGD